MKKYIFGLFILLLFCKWQDLNAQANQKDYLSEIKGELQKKWPDNHTINLVFYGHSVPAGYAKTPEVRTFDSYPFLLLKELKSQYPYAVLNIIIAAIGGETSEQGARRFKRNVLVYKPDVLFIDYALNDRSIGLEKSKVAMEKVIKKALKKGIKIILLTPSPDMGVDLTKTDNKLELFTNQIIRLAAKYDIGLVDSYAQFKKRAKAGENLGQYMAQINHPNRKGNEIITKEITNWFKL